MQLDNLQTSSDVRLRQILHTLNHVHGIEFNPDVENIHKLVEYQTHFTQKKENIIKESGFNSYLSNPEYAKSVLILEAIKIMLTEIAPKRRKVKKTRIAETRGMTGASNTPPPKTFAQQLMQIAGTVKGSKDSDAAFSNILSQIGEKLQDKDPGVKTKDILTPIQLEVLEFIKSFPRPVNIDELVKKGVEKFGHELANRSKIKTAKYKAADASVSEEAQSMPDLDVDDTLLSADEKVKMPSGIDDSPAMSQAHHYEYQASMARSELFRNAKYAMSMMKQISPEQEIQPWIAAELTKAATYLDKIFHYMDYYKQFEPEQLPENMDGDAELGETSGSTARQNLMMIIEYSQKLFELIKPNDKLEGWVAMKLTKASESISSCKHYMDYVQFEHNALDDHFKEARKNKKLKEEVMLAEQEDLAKASTILAAKDMCSKVQSIAEDIAKMSVEDLMPLVDIMRQQFGPEATNAFNELVKKQLDQLLDLATETKEMMDNAVDTINKGGVPNATSDIETAGDAEGSSDADADDLDLDMGDEESGDETGDDDLDLDLDLGDDEGKPDMKTPEPLGRKKKEEIAEKWNAKMHTAKKDEGKWEGYSIAELKSKKNKLMKKEKRTQAEQKIIKQLNFAIRAKTGWGKVKEDETMEGNEFSGALAKAKKAGEKTFKVDGKTYQVHEGKGKNATCKECGGKFVSEKSFSKCKEHKNVKAILEVAPPGKKAERFIKSQKNEFIKRYGKKKGLKALYAKAWKQFSPKNENYTNKLKVLESKQKETQLLIDQFNMHRAQFQRHLKEGRVQDPVNVGYGIQGEQIALQIEKNIKQIIKNKTEINQMVNEGILGMIQNLQSLNRIEQLTKLAATTPYGVVYNTKSGKKNRKLFENEAQRSYWLEYAKDQIQNVKLIDPSTFINAINFARKG